MANALTFASAGDSSASGGGRLSDVHVGLPPSGVEGGSVHLISGSYDYNHYMQAGAPHEHAWHSLEFSCRNLNFDSDDTSPV